MRPRVLFRGPRNVDGGHLGDPMWPSGWFDESPDDS